ncbi:hypothetical protein [Kitasatospora sp. NPDC096140]|uniref:hypothetical protein n=1 Tax=Kitasatospora sp. NPDC096140 TaxID=3155425 RepID=UPI0033307E04
MATADLAFHPLTFVTERDGTMVGRPDTGSFALLPEDGAALLRRLADGMPLAEAAAWYHATYGEPVDLADFVETMRDLGFVHESGAAAEPAPVRFQAWGRAMFSPLGWSCYALITALAIAAMIHEPRLQPHTRNVFFVPSLVAVEVTLAVLQMPLMLWHEGWHVLAGRRLGLPTGLGIGRRLYFVVFETRLDALFGVRPAQRHLPFLAGMLGEVVLFGVLTLAAAADLATGPSWAGRFALAVAYLILPRLAWQFLIFLRTDLYYVLATALGCANLHEVGSAYLRHRLGRGRGGWAEDRWSARERALAPWFALLTAIGTAVLLVAAVFTVVLPTVTFAQRLADGIAHRSLGDSRLWDAAVALLVIVVQVVVLPLLVGRRQRRAAA